ncbi:OmpA family protein [Fulvivirga sedimenti]|uniref:OmpA family protein n=1 Tax=Fulvivirga sedimenti TaxID=2879465 RepID=A0A9X1HYF7_9BACT|nr:OmpA family protein [Fulvivirga sedimenti]MCA6078862.1 OmpA family protein [Fulvivirga sedimenti]
MRSLFIILIIFSSGPLFSQQDESLIRKSIYFGGGSYYIDPYQILELRKFMESVEDIRNYEVILFSHTDPIGGKEYNEWLSQKRSEAVYNQLLNMQIPEELIKIRDFGRDNPLYTNNSGRGRQMNRRVDVILWPVVF